MPWYVWCFHISSFLVFLIYYWFSTPNFPHFYLYVSIAQFISPFYSMSVPYYFFLAISFLLLNFVETTGQRFYYHCNCSTYPQNSCIRCLSQHRRTTCIWDILIINIDRVKERLSNIINTEQFGQLSGSKNQEYQNHKIWGGSG